MNALTFKQPLRTLFGWSSPSATPIPELKPVKQYAIAVSPALLRVLDHGLSRAILDRLERPGLVAPALIEEDGVNLYEFSVRERAIFRYQRAEHFPLDTLLAINQMIWVGEGNFVGTLAELDLLSSWAEHEQDFLSLTDRWFRQYKDSQGLPVHKSTIDGWLGELIDTINQVDCQVVPIRLNLSSWPFLAWFTRKPKQVQSANTSNSIT